MKKRILSLILALSMVLSVLPLGAFAADPLPELVMGATGYPVCSNGTTGDGWEYSGGILTLTNGSYDFNYFYPKTNGGGVTEQTVRCEIKLEQNATITGGDFEANVTNDKGTISGGFFADGVTNSGTITGNGTFNGQVTNEGTNATIENGTFNGDVENRGTINNGTFEIFVKNEGPIEKGTISGGTFKCTVMNEGTINNGIFEENVENDPDGTISGGAFSSTVSNYSGTIYGGTFAGGVDNRKDGLIFGGVFNGVIEGTTGAGVYHITVDEASPGAKIEKVNGVPAEWDPYVVIEPGETKEVTVTASTEIYSLNHKPLSTNPYYSSQDSNDKNTVTFIMQNEGVKIGCGGLIMTYDGYPIGSNNGTADCKGNGWTYSKKDASNPKGKLTLTDGTYDFSYTYPQNSNGAGAEPVACAVETQLRVEITGGTFEGEVINNDLGEISGGTFHEKVSNYNGMIIGGTFKSSVTSTGNGRIFGGVFNSKTTPKPATDAYSITLDAAYPNAKITEVNGVPAEWEPYVVVTQWTKSQKVTITADTEIFSLNGKPIGDGNCNSSYGSDKTIVTFTMPGEPVVLNGAITCTDLVMEKGWPEASNEGKISCSGTDWSYDHNTKTLTLTSGEYDFSSTEPVQCAIKSSATITGGTFEKKVTNNAGGIISGGIFQDTCSVTNNGTIRRAPSRTCAV